MDLKQSLVDSLLPRWHKHTPKKTCLGRQVIFTTNWFASHLKKYSNEIHQYAIFLTPQIPQDSISLREKIMRTIRPQLKKLIDYISGQGFIIYGKLKVNTAVLLSQFQIDNQVYKYEVLMKHTKILYTENFINNDPTKSCTIQNVININTKNSLKKLGLSQLKRGQFYSRQENKTDRDIFVLGGYNMTVIPSLKKQFYLQIDMISRIMRSQTFNETLKKCIKQMSKQEINLKYCGKRSVITNYGSMRTYSILDIDFSKSPGDKFQTQKGQLSFIDYFLDNYKYAIKDQKQPLLKVRSNRKKRIQNAQINQSGQEYIYLIPEMVSLSGLDDNEKADYRLNKSLAEKTNKTPQTIMEGTAQMISKLNNLPQLMYNISHEPLTLQGQMLQEPSITMQGRKVELKNSNFLVKKVESPYNFQSIAICYSVQQSKEQRNADDDFADDALYALQQSGKSLGIDFQKDIIWITVEYKGHALSKDWTQKLNKVYSNKTNRPQFIVFLLGRRQYSFYDQIKKFTIETLKTPSQFIWKDNIDIYAAGNDMKKQKKLRNITDKIMVQINSKMGFPVWITNNFNSYWNKHSLILGGITMSKGKAGSYLAFVGTNTTDLNQYYNDCTMIKNKGHLTIVFFKDLYLRWIRSYFDKNDSKLPTTIVIYREGLNDKQAQNTLQFEIRGLLQAIGTIEQKQKVSFNPSIVQLLVNKKSNTHLFLHKNPNSSKQVPFYQNPKSGSIVYQQLSVQGYKQFHLVSNEVRLDGSCTPVVYRIGYERGDIPLQVLGELTFYQCFQYANWSGAIKIPGVLQNSNKMSKLHSQLGIDGNVSKQLKSIPYYL